MLACIGLAASLALTAGWLWQTQIAVPAEVTASLRSDEIIPSEVQRLTLADGSIVHLKGGAVVEPAFAADERHVKLERGEARFEVAPGSNRPFIVHVGQMAGRAIGTK
jgi:ferric-dicitrate binding protein FerR (iron transport regulator)